MGYLDNSTITVDAVLTNRGRELLSGGGSATSNFEITKFALADDEVDYTLYNSAHPLGSNAAGRVIEKMPILEASTDDAILMRYKLVTITTDATGGAGVPGPGGSFIIPTILLGTPLSTGNTATLSRAAGGGAGATLTLANIQTNTAAFGTSIGATVTEASKYTVIIADSQIADFVTPYPTANNNLTDSVRRSSRGPVVATGTQFQIRPKNGGTNGTTKVTVYGNSTGATFSFDLIVTA
jgi:hypothetical protein